MTDRTSRAMRARDNRNAGNARNSGDARHGQRDSEKLGMILEPGQLVNGRQQPVPRAALSRRVQTALWILRIFVIVVGVMVVYTFASQLGH